MVRKRFVDRGRWLGAFSGEFVVRCPGCGAAAMVRRPWDHRQRHWGPATVTCLNCGFARRQDRSGGCECGRCRRAVPDGWAGPVLTAARCRCSRCGRRIQVQRRSGAIPSERSVTLVCDGCGATTATAYTTHPVTVPDALVDNCFGLPLWLQTTCARHTLWAFNAHHLAYLREFLEAELRERRGATGASVVSRLPGWLKHAKHRDDALRAIDRLERSLLR